MQAIDIRRKHSLSGVRAHKIVQELAETLAEKHGVAYHWKDHTLYCERRGIK